MEVARTILPRRDLAIRIATVIIMIHIISFIIRVINLVLFITISVISFEFNIAVFITSVIITRLINSIISVDIN